MGHLKRSISHGRQVFKPNHVIVYPLDVSASEEDYDPVYAAREISSMFNLIGCPLLLACMCMERYLAILRPVLYLRVRKMEYRFAVCTVVWFVTLSFCLATGKCWVHNEIQNVT